MRLLDLYCGAGGAAVGYARAGFEVVGVDVNDQPRFPFEFHKADALEFDLAGFDAVHASPPCQRFSKGSKRWRGLADTRPDLIAATRDRLVAAGVPYVIENVDGARHLMRAHVPPLCGSAFGLPIRRHRFFETNWFLLVPPCSHHSQPKQFPIADKRFGKLGRVVRVAGHLDFPGDRERRNQAMGIDWMKHAELVEALPPAYTEFIGRALLAYLVDRRVEAEA